MKKSIIVIIILLGIQKLYAQETGVIYGTAIDKSIGETVIGAKIVVVELEKSALTNIDGNYKFKLPVGTYTLRASYFGLQKVEIANVKVLANKETKIDIDFEPESSELEITVIQAEAVKNTDASVIAIQKAALSVQDGISSQQISRTGASNAAESVKQISGANVEDGKYMVMRGLGDRYSLTQLNGMLMPSIDPYRNSSPLDLIPTGVIDNMITIKTFTPDLPGNFSGGLMNVTTRSFPTSLKFNFGISSSYNTQANLIENFKAQPSGLASITGDINERNFLPDDLKTEQARSLLTNSVYLQTRNPNPNNDEHRKFNNIATQQLSNEFYTQNFSTPLNSSVSFDVGNTVKLFGKDLGFTLGANYDQSYSHYEDGIIRFFQNTTAGTLLRVLDVTETKSTQNIGYGAFLNLAYNLHQNHKISLIGISNNDFNYSARQQEGRNFTITNNARLNVEAFDFMQRNSSTAQLSGRHFFPSVKNLEIDWSASYTVAEQVEPDVRAFSYGILIENGDTTYEDQGGGYQKPLHFYRDLNDDLFQVKLDLTLPITKNAENKIKVGGYSSALTRAFNEYRFDLTYNTGEAPFLNFTQSNGDLPNYFSQRNFGLYDTLYDANGNVTRYRNGFYYVNQVVPSNFYTGNQNITAAYAMGSYKFTDKFKAVAGARLEVTDMGAESEDTKQEAASIQQSDILPSINLIYSVSDKTNFRLSANRTLARPNLREISPFELFDTKNGFRTNGNPDLVNTEINNFDLRYEFYPNFGELFSISLYYKQFLNPIIISFEPDAQAVPEIRYINTTEADVYGAEFELRKNLGFIASTFKNFSFATNFSLIRSNVSVPEDEINNSKDVDSTFELTSRPFQGQAPYIINALLSYVNDSADFEASIFYNVTGPTLSSVAIRATPDLYLQPRPQLNIKLSKTFKSHFGVSLKATNLLNPYYLITQEFKGEINETEKFRLGRTFTLGLSYKL